MSHYVCVTGGRDYTDIDCVRDVLTFLHRFYGAELGIIHGDAPGADTLAALVCAELGVKVRAYPADWRRHGKPAGMIRNRYMASLLVKWRAQGHTVQVVAFPGGSGTADMCDVAERADIDVDRVGTVVA